MAKLTEQEIKQRIYYKVLNNNKDEKWAKHMSSSNKYIELKGMFVAVCDRLPTIKSRIYYDDEFESPEVNFETFVRYNETNRPKLIKIERYVWGSLFKPYIQTSNYEIGRLTEVQVESHNENDPMFVTEDELEIINQAIKEVQEHFDKRLKTYWKKYSDKITTYGYWRDR